MIIDTFHGLIFQGNFEEELVYRPGDIVLKDGEPMVFNGTEFLSIGVEPTDKKDESLDANKILPVKCKCCGASLVWQSGIIKCGYCGTEYK